ncbi:hypothetical protein GCM10009102_33070 [Sphingomonas insulae]|uniref:Glycoside hydrolase family 5 domain-containing protein n=2 Tax=Sphingomonas insulae TaxID=424800 RepID=A0ABP3T3I1_9SPHN
MHRPRRYLWLFVLAALSSAGFANSAAAAQRVVPDFAAVRGVNHGLAADLTTLARDLGYAKRVNLNSTRIWLSQADYEKQPGTYIAQLRDYVRTSYRLGFTTMPILFNGNGLNPETLSNAFATRADAYVAAVMGALQDEPGVLAWDVMNEPFTNPYHDAASPTERAARSAEITRFVRHALAQARRVAPDAILTVGYTFPQQMEATADMVDVLSFHDYSETRAGIEGAYRAAEAIARRSGKPLMNTETGCIARANPYDAAIEAAAEHRTGFYLFNLIIAGYWRGIHGIFYPDGTVRDPSTVSALMGFYRQRDMAGIVRPQPDREGTGARAVAAIDAALKGQGDAFNHVDAPTDALLDAAERAANLLEASDMVAMEVPPTARIRAWRATPAERRDRDAIRRFAYEMGMEVKSRMLLY